jgi:hypothetical protein
MKFKQLKCPLQKDNPECDENCDECKCAIDFMKKWKKFSETELPILVANKKWDNLLGY